MKFMKLGSKPDTIQADGNDIRYVATELASDIIVNVGDVKFYLHKFPLLSKSILLQKLVATSTAENSDEVHIPDIPGGPAAFETCAKFCYGMTVTLNAYNVVSARCAAEYLGMHESIEKGNLIYKIDAFLSSSIFRSWKDSIILLQSTTSLLSLAEDLKLVSHCIDCIASKASIDISRVDWSYTYNRKKLPKEYRNDPNSNGIRNRLVPMDWWVEDLCELDIDLFKRVIMGIKSKCIISNEVVGEALKAYSVRKLPGFGKDMIQRRDMKNPSIVNTIVWLLPAEKHSVSCSFLLKLLKAANIVDSGEMAKMELVRRIGQQLEEASVNDLLIRSPEGGITMYDVDAVKNMVEEFIMQDQNAEIEALDSQVLQEMRRPGILSNASKLMVVNLVDGYLAEIAKDPNLPLSKFVDLAEMVSGFSRPSHDGLYRAIDMYLKEHSGISKSDRKRICKLMDCKKLSADACVHAVQNERLPMRVVVQVLFFEQARAAASSGSSTPDLHKCIKLDLNSGSNGSSRSATTNTEEDWDADHAETTAEEVKALKEELAFLRLSSRSSRGSERHSVDSKNGVDKASLSKVKGLLMPKKMFTKLWSSKGGQGDNSGSDSSEGPGSANQDEAAKNTPSRNRRYSVY